jgi:hypothetical protein
MYSWQHCGTGTLSYRQPRHFVIMDQWKGQQRAVAIKMFYMFGFLQFLLGFSKVPVFLCHIVYEPTFGNAESRLFLFAAQCFNI